MRIRRRITSAHLISIVALFVALGGTVYAAGAINGRSIKKESIPGNRLRADSLTGAQVNEGTLGTVPSARAANQAETAKQADSAKGAASAKHADEADNAKALAGVPANGYQRSCQAGAVKGTVTVETASLPNNGEFVGVDGFNCARPGRIQARRTGVGEYVVEFEDLPMKTLPPSPPATTSILTGTAAAVAKVRPFEHIPPDQRPGFLVLVVNSAGIPVDNAIFSLIVY